MPDSCVDVVIEDERWAALGLGGLAQRAVAATLARLAPEGEWEVTVLACDDMRIAALNSGFRGKAQPTNVLSWPSAERAAATPGTRPEAPESDEPELGDIAISYETCIAEARAGGIAPEAHVTHLLVHGTLHLLGYDHEDDTDGDLMEATEVGILESLGIANPYETT